MAIGEPASNVVVTDSHNDDGDGQRRFSPRTLTHQETAPPKNRSGGQRRKRRRPPSPGVRKRPFACSSSAAPSVRLPDRVIQPAQQRIEEIRDHRPVPDLDFRRDGHAREQPHRHVRGIQPCIRQQVPERQRYRPGNCHLPLHTCLASSEVSVCPI